jgi:ATP-dependent DNA ligase
MTLGNMRELGLEGIVAKLRDRPYKSGRCIDCASGDEAD